LDEDVAQWLEKLWKQQSFHFELHEGDTFLEILRDELTVIHESIVASQTPDVSGTWHSDADEWQSLMTAEEAAEEFQSRLQQRLSESLLQDVGETREQVDGCVAKSENVREVFDLSHMTAAERVANAARLRGVPIVDPPHLGRKGTLSREDAPYYITLSFPKIFQTGAGDYWKWRRERKIDIGLVDWFRHVLRHRSGRAARHRRFFFFALKTILRSKAKRKKAWFARRDFTKSECYEEFKPEVLLKMDKTKLTQRLTCMQQALPGSAQEKLHQRAELESLLHHLETESLCNASD
jgi:hypothetical protein